MSSKSYIINKQTSLFSKKNKQTRFVTRTNTSQRDYQLSSPQRYLVETNATMFRPSIKAYNNLSNISIYIYIYIKAYNNVYSVGVILCVIKWANVTS